MEKYNNNSSQNGDSDKYKKLLFLSSLFLP